MIKKTSFYFVFFVFFVSMQMYALELDVNACADNFAFLDDGTISAKIPDFGFDAEITGNFTGTIGAMFKMQRTPQIGNLIKARVVFGKPSMLFSIGPSIGVLNKQHKKSEFSTVFQPGMGVGMQILTEKGFLLRFDLDFSIFTGLSEKNIYINNGDAEIGMRTEHTLVSLSASQLTRTSTMQDSTTSSLTDFGLNFKVFSKPSRFIFPIACLFRIAKYRNKANSSKDVSTGSIVVRAGFEHNIYTDLGYYIRAEIPVYTMALSGTMPTAFRYNVTAGVKFRFD
jgi:hypothetical protein